MATSRTRKYRLTGLLTLLLPGLFSSMPLAQLTDDEAIQIDHLVLGTADLETGIDFLYRLTGVRAEYGGEHPGRGTHNALMSLGEGQYLEIMAPLPGADLDQFHENLVKLVTPEPIMWGVSTRNIEATKERLASGSFGYEEPFSMSRTPASGEILNWHIMLMDEPELTAAPFFIQWGAGVTHPSRTSPAGCTLTSLTLFDPQPERLRELMDLLEMAVSVDVAAQPVFSAVLDCPKGEIVLGSL